MSRIVRPDVDAEGKPVPGTGDQGVGPLEGTQGGGTPPPTGPQAEYFYRFSSNGQTLTDADGNAWQDGGAFITNAFNGYNSRPTAQQPKNDLEALPYPVPNAALQIYRAEAWAPTAEGKIDIAIPSLPAGDYEVTYTSSDVVLNTIGARVVTLEYQQGQDQTTGLGISNPNHDAVSDGTTVTIADEGGGLGTFYLSVVSVSDNANIVGLILRAVAGPTPPPTYEDSGLMQLGVRGTGIEEWAYAADGTMILGINLLGTEVYEPPLVIPPQITDSGTMKVRLRVFGLQEHESPFWSKNPGPGREDWEFPDSPQRTN